MAQPPPDVHLLYCTHEQISFSEKASNPSLGWISPIKLLYLPMFFISSKDFDMGAPQRSILDKTLREPSLTNKLLSRLESMHDSLGHMTVLFYQNPEEKLN